MYAALEFCVTLVGLQDWTRKTLTRDVRNNGKALPAGMTSLDDFAAFVTDRVSWQAAIEAIANTTKHAEYRDAGWPMGVARPASFSLKIYALSSRPARAALSCSPCCTSTGANDGSPCA
jgi:hypothetical protein